MADTKISGLSALTAPDAADEFVVVDKSDTSMAASGTDKKIKYQDVSFIVARKTSDETVNNSSALQNDDELAIAVAASSTYWVDLSLLVSATGTVADWKFDWTYPSGTTIFWGAYGAGGSSAIPWGVPGTGNAGAAMLRETDAGLYGSGNFTQGLVIRAIVVVSTTAGTLQFRWAQNTPTAADSKVLANSVLLARKIG